MKTYLLTATSVIFLSVIISLIIPEGKLNKSIVFVMRMACILVLISPITKIFKVSKVESTTPMYDYEYICGVYSENQSKQLEQLLSKEYEEQSDCSVEVVYDEGQFKVASVSVEVENSQKINEIYAYLDKLGYINITVYAKSY